MLRKGMTRSFQHCRSSYLLLIHCVISPVVLVLWGSGSLVYAAVIMPEPLQIGAPVPSAVSTNSRSLLQASCGEHMILSQGQCVCAQAYYSTINVPTTSVNGTLMMCAGVTEVVNFARSCVSGNCPAYTPLVGGFHVALVGNNGGFSWGQGDLIAGLGGEDPWWRVDFETARVVGGGRMYGVGGTPAINGYGPYTGKYMIWVGSNPDHYSGVGNSLCYAAPTSTSYPILAQGQPTWDTFACSAAVWGRYAFISRDPVDYAPWYAQGKPMAFTEVNFYGAAGCNIMVSCLACPAGLVSYPGSIDLSDCQADNGVQVNITIDDVDQYRNQSEFLSGLPDGVSDLIYDDQVVVYVETCPTGYFCVSDTTIPAACPVGTYRDSPGAEKLADCLPCPAGYYCPIATTTPLQCAAGTYRGSTGARQPTDCTQCNSGNYCILGSIDPVNCTAGTYRATTGGQALANCLVCPVGQYCGVATTTPVPCAAGTYRESTSGVTQDDCLVCPFGFYCPQQSVTPTQCPAGTYGNQTGASLLSQCKACVVGTYCPIASIIPTPCTAGSYRGTIGAIEQGDCTTCPTAHYCPESSVAPIDCPAGTYFNDTSGTQDTNCQPCDPGTYCPVASTLPTSCPAGYFRDQSGGSHLSSCYICPTGQFCLERTVVPTSCLPGTYRATQGAIQITDCLACPAGQYCPFASTTPVNCPIGSYRGTTGGDDRFSCTACPSGNYCPEQSINPVNCSAGTYRPVPGGGIVGDCIACPTGEYCHQATTVPAPCPSGTFRATEGGTIVGDCAICPVAKYCPIQTTTPQNCAPGTFRETTGAHQQSDCSICPSGNYCPEMSTTPTDCPITTYRSVVGATSLPDCLPCPAGLFCPVETTTPTPCAAGSYRATPSAGSQPDCPTCPLGSYCPIQTITPIKCRAGTHRDTLGATQLSNCLLCQPGTYSLVVGRFTNCPLCDTNFYCRTSTMKDVCPLHTTSVAGSYSRVNCLCDEGYQCTYYKQIQAIVTLNATLWEFNNDINGVRTAFIAAMAAAAGVHPSYVTINEVLTQGGRRRALLSIDSIGGDSIETINVHASVMGAVHLRDLEKHLRRHSPTLHIAHKWEQAPQIHAVAIQGASVPGLRRMGKAPQAPKQAQKAQARSNPITKSAGTAVHTPEERQLARDRVKARAIKLVTRESLFESLNKV